MLRTHFPSSWINLNKTAAIIIMSSMGVSGCNSNFFSVMSFFYSSVIFTEFIHLTLQGLRVWVLQSDLTLPFWVSPLLTVWLWTGYTSFWSTVALTCATEPMLFTRRVQYDVIKRTWNKVLCRQSVQQTIPITLIVDHGIVIILKGCFMGVSIQCEVWGKKVRKRKRKVWGIFIFMMDSFRPGYLW